MDVDDEGRDPELLVLGDGPGAYAVARAAAALGLRAVVVAPPAGTEAGASPAGWPWPFAAVPADATPGPESLAAGAGPSVRGIVARACLAGAGMVMLREPDGASSLRPRRLVLAPRARPSRPSWWRGPLAMPAPPAAADEASSGPAVPSRVIVLGGGHTGVEAASAWAAAGADVLLVEAAGRLLPDWDAGLAARAAAELAARGVALRCGWRAVAVDIAAAGGHVRLRGGGGQADCRESAPLVVPALGWRPALAGLGLERTRVLLDRQGQVQTDGRLATAEPGLHALGVAVAAPLTREAVARQALLVATLTAGGDPAPLRQGLVARVVRGAGPLLQAGLTAAAARERGHRVATARAGDEHAWVRCVRDGETGALLGVQAAGPGAAALAESTYALLSGGEAAHVAAAALPPLLTAALATAAAADDEEDHG